MVFLTVGALNFNLHYAVWRMRRKEIFANLETRTFFLTILLTFVLLAAGLGRLGVYPNAMIIFRKGFYQLLSGHTTTGFGTVYAQQFINEWGGFALLILTIAMGLGACACSTGGGIKALRIGIIFKAMVNDVKRIILPESAIFIEKYHHIKDIILEDRQVRSAAMITLCYIGLYLTGAITGMLLGYPALESLFEATSAASNSGLSCGITQASMPAILKLVYIVQMWAGRLEFMSAFALIGFVVAWIKGK
jgi:trk system potassium uptake protein TrkH